MISGTGDDVDGFSIDPVDGCHVCVQGAEQQVRAAWAWVDPNMTSRGSSQFVWCAIQRIGVGRSQRMAVGSRQCSTMRLLTQYCNTIPVL